MTEREGRVQSWGFILYHWRAEGVQRRAGHGHAAFGRVIWVLGQLGGQAWRLHVETLLSLAQRLSYLCVWLPRRGCQMQSQQGQTTFIWHPNLALPSSDWAVLNKSLPRQEPQFLHLRNGQNLTFSGTTVELSHSTTSESPSCLYKTVSLRGVGVCTQISDSHST